MQVRTGELYDFGVTVVVVTRADGSEWTFLPFDEGSARVVAASDRLLLAFGEAGRLRVFDVVDERCLVDAPALKGLSQALSAWAWAPRRSAFYFAQHRGVREVALDGVNRSHEVQGLGEPLTIAEMAGGRLFLVGCDLDGHVRTATLDPQTGVTSTAAIAGMRGIYREKDLTNLRWFSPDGRRVLRHHLGSILRVGAPKRGWMWPFSASEAALSHPDAVADDVPRYGLVLDVYLTDPLRFEKRLVTRLVTGEDVVNHRLKSGWKRADCDRGMVVIDALADAVDYRRSQMLFAASTDRAAPPRPSLQDPDLHAGFLLRMLTEVAWEPGSAGLEVSFADGLQRRVGLDGAVGPLVPARQGSGASLAETALAPFRERLQRRALHRVVLPDLSATACAEAITAVAAMIESGLEELVFRDSVGFEFALPDQVMTESRFFAEVGAAGPSERPALVSALRAMMASFGRQIGALKSRKQEQLQAVEAGRGPDWAQAALTEPALALARLDPSAFDVLKAWFGMIDGEHDVDSAARVFSAIAATSRFEGAGAIAFGLWFGATASQSWRGTAEMNALMEAARRQLTPAAFAERALSVILEASARYGQAVHLPALPVGEPPPEVQSLPSRLPDPPSARAGGVLELLDAKEAWDREVKADLEARLQGAEADHQRLVAAIEAERRRRLAAARRAPN